jgi:hypothetical protein
MVKDSSQSLLNYTSNGSNSAWESFQPFKFSTFFVEQLTFGFHSIDNISLALYQINKFLKENYKSEIGVFFSNMLTLYGKKIDLKTQHLLGNIFKLIKNEESITIHFIKNNVLQLIPEKYDH